jgi:hypothetical protein
VYLANIDKYFKELANVLTKYGLNEKPYLIFNIDEKESHQTIHLLMLSLIHLPIFQQLQQVNHKERLYWDVVVHLDVLYLRILYFLGSG